MITVIDKLQPCVGISGTETVAGSAYRLVHDSNGSGQNVGRIYIRTYGTQLLNLTASGHRSANHTDRYVEVDLDIIVKEKS